MEENVKTQTSECPKQLTYDELKEVAGQLQQQNMQLRRTVQELSYKAAFDRLEFLFKVINASHIFSDSFVAKCVKEIEDTMTIPEEDNSKEE